MHRQARRRWQISRHSYLIAIVITALGASAASPGVKAPELAATPPMGWNSYDGYGVTINEADFKANAESFAHNLKPFGWQYLVIDAEWYVSDPVPEGNSKTFHAAIDAFGRFVPAENRFPSAVDGAGFKPLADYVHALGLKFGIHILRGIPRLAVEKNLPIAGSHFHASEAADTSDTCPWNYDNYGIDPSKPAGQAYYDSIAELYSSWGIDLIKADCIASHPYKGDEIRILSTALRNTGRPIVLSVSPGPAPREKAEELGRYTQMWRISDDVWDLWHSDASYPQGLGDQFANAAKWASFSRPGNWPDADMLPLGRLGPAPGWGKPRDTRLSQEEQRTMLTLWSIIRSPLMIGGDLTSNNEWTTRLLTNPEVIAVDQDSTDNRPITVTGKVVVWTSRPKSGGGYYLAVFNISPDSEKLHYAWPDLGLTSAEYNVRDLWEHKDIGLSRSIDLILPSHACKLYRVSFP